MGIFKTISLKGLWKWYGSELDDTLQTISILNSDASNLKHIYHIIIIEITNKIYIPLK